MNDRLNCDPKDSAHANAKLLNDYLSHSAHCSVDGSEQLESSSTSVGRFYQTDEQVIRNAPIDDNMGEYFVHIDVH